MMDSKKIFATAAMVILIIILIMFDINKTNRPKHTKCGQVYVSTTPYDYEKPHMFPITMSIDRAPSGIEIIDMTVPDKLRQTQTHITSDSETIMLQPMDPYLQHIMQIDTLAPRWSSVIDCETSDTNQLRELTAINSPLL